MMAYTKPIVLLILAICICVSGCKKHSDSKTPPPSSPPVKTAIAPKAKVGSGPFGLEMGLPVSQLSIVNTLAENVYEVKVPVTNSEFEKYVVVATNKDGICKIIADGITHQNDKNGSDTRSAYETLTSTLHDKYGPSESYNYLHSGSIWSGPNEWAASFNQNDRTLSDFWSEASHSRLTNGLKAIALEVKSAGMHDLFIRLSYEFNNFKACREPDTQRNKQAL